MPPKKKSGGGSAFKDENQAKGAILQIFNQVLQQGGAHLVDGILFSKYFVAS
jgi:hypothetical protein